MNVLIVAAHPDDEVLGCGGTASKLAGLGNIVRIAILAEGMTSRTSKREDSDTELLTRLHADAQRAGRILRAQSVTIHGFPDNRLDTVPMLDVVKAVESIVREFQPEVIYTHHPGDLNVDHGVVHRAVLTAIRPLQGNTVKRFYAFEVPSSTEWAFQRIGAQFTPNTFVDIGETLEQKLAAMQAYESEARKFPHPRSPEALRAIAMRWGSVIGVRAAEAFELIWSLE